MSWYRLRRGVQVRISSPRDVKLRLTLIPKGRNHSLVRRQVDFAAGKRIVVIRPKREALGARRSQSLRLRVKLVNERGAISYRSFAISVHA
jgi:hypothetical protein